MNIHTGLLLAHELFPSFPPFGVILVIILVVSGLIALASRRGAGREAGSGPASISLRAASDSTSAEPPEPEEAERADRWEPALRIPFRTFALCAATVPLSFVPGLSFVAGIIQMPGFAVVYALMLSDVLPDDMGQLSFALLCALIAWVCWTIVASLVSPP